MAVKRKVVQQIAQTNTNTIDVIDASSDEGTDIQLNVGHADHLNSFQGSKVGSYEYDLERVQSESKVDKKKMFSREIVPKNVRKQSDAISIDDLSDDVDFESSYIVSGSSLHGSRAKESDDNDVVFFTDSEVDDNTVSVNSTLNMSAEDVLSALGGEVVDTDVQQKRERKRQQYKLAGRSTKMQCYVCREVGHTSRDCPMDTNQLPCNICALPGHAKASNCPNELCVRCCNSGHRVDSCASRKLVQCFRCGSPFHDVTSCDVRASIHFYDTMQKHCKCLSCGQYGHTDCTSSTASQQKYNADCINCGARGHTYLACDDSSYNHNKRNRYSSSSSSRNDDYNRKGARYVSKRK